MSAGSHPTKNPVQTMNDLLSGYLLAWPSTGGQVSMQTCSDILEKQTGKVTSLSMIFRPGLWILFFYILTSGDVQRFSQD